MSSPSSSDWWVMHGDGPPVGPVSTALLIQGIQAGKVPRDSLVCEVGGTEWRRLVSIPDLAEAFAPRPRRRFDPESERTQFDDAPLPPEEEEERSSRPTNTEVTVVDGLRSSAPPRDTLRVYDDPEEKTSVGVSEFD